MGWKKLFFIVIGILVAAWGFFEMLDVRRFMKSGSQAFGTIGTLTAGSSHFLVDFTTASGQKIIYPQNGWVSGFKTGDKVNVIYDTIQPGHACINSFGALCGFAVVKLVFGILGVLIAFFSTGDE